MTGSPRDSDAELFLNTIGTTDMTIRNAVNYVVIAGKNTGWYQAMYAGWAMVGASYATCKYNIVDPRDLDAAYRWTEVGTAPMYASTGVKWAAGFQTRYGDSKFVDSTWTFDDASMSYYSRTNNTTQGYDMGTNAAGSPFNVMGLYGPAIGPDCYFFQAGGEISFTPYPTSTGLITVSSGGRGIVSRTRLHVDGAILATSAGAPTNTHATGNVQIGSGNSNSGSRECAWADISRWLSPDQVVAKAGHIRIFNQMLSRA